MRELRTCRACPVPHVYNCPDCLGWGFLTVEHPDGPIPITAARVAEVANGGEWRRCEVCWGTPRGRQKVVPRY